MIYKANFIEDAVVRIDEVHRRAFAKLRENLNEYEVSINGDMANGNSDYLNTLYEITKAEYETFGKAWEFGEKEKEKKPIT